MNLDNLSGSELVLLASFFAIYISQGLTPEQIGTLGDFFSALGDNLSLLSSGLFNKNSS